MTHALSIWASGHDPGVRRVDLSATGEAPEALPAAVATIPPGSPGDATSRTGERA